MRWRRNWNQIILNCIMLFETKNVRRQNQSIFCQQMFYLISNVTVHSLNVCCLFSGWFLSTSTFSDICRMTNKFTLNCLCQYCATNGMVLLNLRAAWKCCPPEGVIVVMSCSSRNYEHSVEWSLCLVVNIPILTSYMLRSNCDTRKS